MRKSSAQSGDIDTAQSRATTSERHIMNMIKPARNYAAIRKANRAAKLNNIKQTLLSYIGFVLYLASLAIMAAAIYIIAVALM